MTEGKPTAKFDISKSVRFDSRVLATVGKYLVTECDYPITTSTDLIRTAITKLAAFIEAANGEKITSYVEAREWFLSHGLGDLYKQGAKVNKAHVRVSAQENELFTAFNRTGGMTARVSNKPEGYESLSTEEQKMIDSLEAPQTVTVAREMTSVEPESRKGDVNGLAELDLDALIKGES